MTLQEAKEQIAKNHLLETWTFLCNVKDKHYIIEAYEEAINLVLSSKDKEIAELKENLSEANNSLKYAAEDTIEYKDKITHLKEMWKQCSDREIRITDILRSEIKSLESELSQLKEQNLQLSEQLDQDGDVIQSLQEEIKRLSEWHNDKEREADAECLSIAVAEAEQEFHAKNNEELKELKAKNFDLSEEMEKIKENTKLDIEDLQSENAALRKDNSELAETVISLREEMKKKEWISIKKRLPKEGGPYLTVVKKITFDGEYFPAIEIHPFGFYENEWYLEKRITHWQPLPEPPKI